MILRSLLALSLASTVASQPLFDFAQKRDLGPRDQEARTQRIHTLDYDADGNLDFLMSSNVGGFAPGAPALRRGLGDGRFVPVGPSTHGFSVESVGDIDGDGLIEFVSDYGRFEIDRQGVMRSVGQQLQTYGAGLLHDLDADGDLDFVRSFRGIEVWIQEAGGFFALSQSLPAAKRVDSIQAADLDRDGDGDLLIVGSATGVLLNNGQGVFSDGSARLPWQSDAIDGVCDDFDGDGAVDVLLIPFRGQALQLALQRGAAFVDASARIPFAPGAVTDVAAGDLDADGFVDLAIGNRGGGILALGSATGFRSIGGWPSTDWTRQVALADVDRDGDLDLIQGGYVTHDRLHFNDGRGVFTGASSFERYLQSGWTDRVVVADFNGDAAPDLAKPGEVWINGGFGETFQRRPAPSGKPAARGDLNGDGFVDVLAIEAHDRYRVHFGDGRGGFSPGPTRRITLNGSGLNTEFLSAIGVGDFDGDGDQDVICVTSPDGPVPPSRDSMWRNDGTGGLTEDPAWNLSSQDLGSDVAVGDLDGDGLDDFTDGAGVFVQRANGKFDYVAPSGSPCFDCKSTPRNRVALGDLDGDGDLDAVQSTQCYYPGCDGRWDVVGWNDGAGSMRLEWFGAYQESTDVAILDADEDGDLDVFFSRVSDRTPNSLWINQGGGRFVEAQEGLLPLAQRDTSVARVADFDLDGDEDLYLFGSWGGVGRPSDGVVWSSYQRQLAAPDLLGAGRRYRLQLHGVDRAGLILGAPLLARQRTPFGWLGLDPRTTVVFAAFNGPTTGRRADLELVVPASPALVGRTYAFQGAVQEAGGAIRLTNRMTDTFVAY